MTRPVVRLEPWEVDVARGVAGQTIRAIAARGMGHGYYTAIDPTGPDALRDRTLSLVCEIAVGKCLDRYVNLGAWAAYTYHHDSADGSTDLEVRRITRMGNPVKVSEKDVRAERNIVVTHATLDRGGAATVTILGYVPAAIAWDHGTPVNYGGTGSWRAAPPNLLRPIKLQSEGVSA